MIQPTCTGQQNSYSCLPDPSCTETAIGLPYSAGHAIQALVLPRPCKAKVTDLDEGGMLPIKERVVQFHVPATCNARSYSRLVMQQQGGNSALL